MQIGDQREYSHYNDDIIPPVFVFNFTVFTIPFMWLCFEICGSDVEMQKSHLLYFQSSQFPLEVY